MVAMSPIMERVLPMMENISRGLFGFGSDVRAFTSCTEEEEEEEEEQCQS